MLRNRDLIFAAWISIGHPSIAEIFALGQFDFLAIDMEHSTINLEQAQRIIAASQTYDRPCLPRPVSHSNDFIKPLLDSGADGLILPLVTTPQEVSNLIDHIKYPPIGKRSYGINRAQNYGATFDEYITNWNENSIFIPQIETKVAVDNIEKIIDNTQIDAVMVGPYDLTGSFGYPGQLTHLEILKAQEKIVTACQKNNISCGIQIKNFTRTELNFYQNLGYNLLFASSDIFLITNWVESATKLIFESKSALND